MLRTLLSIGLLFLQTTIIPNTTVVPNTTTIAYAVPVGPGGISATNLQVWYRADNLTCTGGCTGTNVVTSLNDKSTNANNCTTSGSPTYVASALNSQPGIQGNGTSQYCTMGTPIAWSGNITIFVVQKCSGFSAIFGHVTGANALQYFTCAGGGEQQIQQSGVGTLATGTTATDGNFHQLGFTYNNSAYAFYIASTTDGSGTAAGTISASSSLIGQSEASNYLNGQLCEVFIYTRTLTSGEISTVQSYLNGRYGV